MPPAQDRQIRVFISSTFRDMGAERDHLVKFIFPQLRKLCESRGVTWGEVDLRWGVTDEAAAEGKVLPICLEEIKRCRPYFIGLLGERYGWVPDSIPEELLESQTWLQQHLHRSVTELEIVHGVFSEEQMHGHSYFYFRDPGYLENVPKEKQSDFITEDPKSAEKLRKLKQKIRAARDEQVCSLREGYTNAQQLGDWILEDFTELIERLFPEGSQPDPLDREAMDHEAFAQSRARVYIGRDEYFQKLDAHAAGDGDQPFVILGESGSGKSALLANWASHHRATHPDDFLLLHFIGATPYSSDWAAMLRRIMGEFKRHFGIAQEIPDQPDALRAAFANWLHMAARGGRSATRLRTMRAVFANWLHMATARGRVILVLDSLNQLEDRDGAPDLVWLPPVMPKNVRLIVSTLPGRALEEISNRHWPALRVEALNAAERQQFINDYLKLYTKALSHARVTHIAESPQAANPLYLRALLEELRLFGGHERLDERITHYLQAGTVPQLYEKILARWEADYAGGTNLVRDSMTLLWAARRGLTEAELLHALGKDGEPLPRAQWSPLFLATGDSLVSRSGLLTFFHDYLREAVRNAYIPAEKDQRAAHMRLADYFQKQPASPRRTDELPWQLSGAEAWERLQALLTDRTFFTAAWEQNQFDVKARWAQVEAGSQLRMVEAYRTLIEQPEHQSDKNHLWRLSLLLSDTGHPEEALRLRSALVSHFRSTGDLQKLRAALGNQGLVLKEHGDLDGAMALHKEAEGLCHRLGNLQGLAFSLGNQAMILKTRGELDHAMTLHKQEERIFRELGDLSGLAISLGNQAVILGIRGKLDDAMALHEQEERIYRQLGNSDGLQRALGSQAVILQTCGELDDAMALLKEQERICRQLNNLDELQCTLGNQAVVLKARGKLDDAMALSKEKERLCRRLRNLDGLQAALGIQAMILRARSDFDGAMTLLKEQERICRQLGNLVGLQRALGDQAVILGIRGKLDDAWALGKETERLCRQLGNLNDLQAALGNQAVILQLRGKLDDAMVLHKEQEQICRRLGNMHGLVTSLTNQSLLLRLMARAREGLPLAEEALRLARSHGYATLARQIEPILQAVRQAALGG